MLIDRFSNTSFAASVQHLLQIFLVFMFFRRAPFVLLQQLGCDNQLHSKLTNDACGVCGGNGTTCNVIEGEFTQMSGQGVFILLALSNFHINCLFCIQCTT